ncbi:lysozyme inhibitor LprI family protein [Flavobacterium humidisoli]|uniref:DUF1311 domain-containing protein n=1 Tax=Flavobacterium humidisoli TaxID=2937442 RepID=A0ABY4LPT2_9FLAO|nr:lysozyme inhibitor LprI family protein [Flavobacterium humidisoli]UPZ13645.1 DUF1311 domain-containing protein [Flavobacterium humidisoli]
MKKVFIITFLLLSVVTFSQTKKENPIDVLESKCLNKENISNAEMCNCTIQARESWDKELNKYYSLLKTKLSKEAFETLKESQKQWLVYRDKEYAFISKYFYEVKQGTMWYAVSESKKRDIVKTRAVELEGYYKMLEY